MEEMSMTMKALQAGLSAEGVTMYLFWLGIVGMGAGSLYLFMMQSALSATYKKVAIVAGIICAVACFHYYRMSTIYVESLANAITIAEDGSVSIGELAAFPTAYRYIDWLITVPLMVLIPAALALGRRANGMFYSLGGISLAMLITAWIAETSPSAQASGGLLPRLPRLLGCHGQHALRQVTKAASHCPLNSKTP